MIKVVAKHYAQTDKMEKILELCKELVAETRKEKGCITYEVFLNVNDPSIYTMIEEWESQENLDAHMQSEHFKRIIPVIGEYLTKDTEVDIYKKVM